MDKKISVSVALAITLIAMTVTVAITMVYSRMLFNNNINATTQRQVLNNKVSDLDKYVRGNYYGDIDDAYLADRAARGYIEGLKDPNCVYYTEKEYAELLEIEKGTRVGIGIEIMRHANGYFMVAKVYPESPAEKAGIVEGSYITHVDGIDVKNYTSVKAVHTVLRGMQGTELKLTCLIEGEKTEEKSFIIQRMQYLAPTIEPLQMVDGFAYIRITSFGPNTYAEFDYIIREAQSLGAIGYVFDLRGNTGGQYDRAFEMIDLICPIGTIVKAEYKNGTAKTLSTSDAETKLDAPMVVVVNAATAGAAELFAMSVRDLAGGQIVGVKTAGRGMLQGSPNPLSDGSAVVVTQAKLLDSKGQSWEGVGLTPEVIVAAGSDDELALYKIEPRTDPQIVRATELARSMAKAAGLDVTTPGTTGGDSSVPSSLPDSTPPPKEDDSTSESGSKEAAE